MTGSRSEMQQQRTRSANASSGGERPRARGFLVLYRLREQSRRSRHATVATKPARTPLVHPLEISDEAKEGGVLHGGEEEVNGHELWRSTDRERTDRGGGVGRTTDVSSDWSVVMSRGR